MLLTICTIPAMAEPERGTLPGGDSFAVTDTTETRQATRQGTPERVTITGKVTDRDSMPLPGVAVVIEGTTVGTSTDPDGNYTLTIEGTKIVYDKVPETDEVPEMEEPAGTEAAAAEE